MFETGTGASSDGRADGRGLATLLRELRNDATTLVRQEVALARAEMSEKLDRVTRNGTKAAVAGVFLAGALFTLIVAAIVGLYLGLVAMGLTNAVAGWLSPLVIGVLLAVVGGILWSSAKSALKEETLVPERTIATLKEDKQWAKHTITPAAPTVTETRRADTIIN